MSKHFRYPFTCSEIDKNIKNFQEYLSNHLNAMIEELNPLFNTTNESVRFINDWEEALKKFGEKNKTINIWKRI